MGFGDVRLSALLSFCLGYLGWAEVAIGVYAGFLVFVVPGLTVALVRRDRAYLKTRVPFGPALVIGALLAIVFGPWISTSLGY
jgi:leader peptidase (prepilin peptidase)/N-methyltransferase